ncbi:hypothetical protein M422DRAFT_67733 [Sphaerobolus stellatus SS14]|uniref:Unplaced genomic scaffold SPHSTscaffold_44, whole genome shotgun sequence n=1 Tax=Sphaerobolus stellatus (strain SS14) TaxID=990650 RepID=A0A0C9UM24_SPHS4|nr:hypothetical protein M422DRAFT_67733 [Sphaerobolus stellatus SS14]
MVSEVYSDQRTHEYNGPSRPPASTMRVHHATGVRTLALCPVPSQPYYICVGLESGNIQRWDLRSKNHNLERIALAHTSAILSMDWQLPSMTETGLGWIVTSGMDKRVKIWDLNLSGNSTISTTSTSTAGNTVSDRDKSIFSKKMGPRAFRVLHTPFPVKKVQWRPETDTEVGIISNNENGSDTVEIWDIRRGWIGKWALEGIESGITDFAFSGSHKIWSLHVNGSFAQYDLRESVKPLDAIPRVSTSWSAWGDMAFVANQTPEVELPYDDIHPFNDRVISDQRIHLKTKTDPIYQPQGEQTVGVMHVPPPSMATFEALARSYILENSSIEAARINAERALEVGHHQAAQTWRLLASLMDAELDQSLYLSAPKTTSAAASRAPSIRSQKVPQSLSLSDSRGVSMSHNFTNTHTASSTPSPRSSIFPLPVTQPEISPVSSRYDNSNSSLSSSSRRASIVALGGLGSHSSVRRGSVSTHNALNMNRVGEGALDDSDSDETQDEDEEEEQEHEGIPEHMIAQSTYPKPRTGYMGRMLPAPSPLSKVAARAMKERDESPDGHLASDELSGGENGQDGGEVSEDSEDSLEDIEPASVSTQRRSSSSTSASGPMSRPGSARSSMSLHFRPRILKQESQSSIRTITLAQETIMEVSSSHELGTATTTSDNAEGNSTRRPSPHHSRAPTLSHGYPGGLGLSLNHSQSILHGSNISHFRQPSAAHQAAALQFRELAWRALNEELERYIEIGDIQTSALLVIVAPQERKGKEKEVMGLTMDEERASRIVEAYVDILERMQLHVLAARVRKIVPFEEVRSVTQTQTTIYASCGQCGTSIRTKPSPPSSTSVPFCAQCKSRPTLCTICHLPVRKLLIHCSTCGHGGHQTCYHAFYLSHPPTEFAGTLNHGVPLSVSSSSMTSSILSGTATSMTPSSSYNSSGGISDSSGTTETQYWSMSDGEVLKGSGSGGSFEEEADDESKDGDKERDRETQDGGGSHIGIAANLSKKVRMRVLGHACAAGCGHFCWAANERFGLPAS